MKKFFIIFSLCLIGATVFAGDFSARTVTTWAAEKDSVEESIEYLEDIVTQISNPAERRSVYIFLASLQELLAFYDDAQRSYARAAGIAAGNGKDMPSRSNEQIVLDAVRCALSRGDYATADSYLNSAVKKSKNHTIQAYIKLYSQWSALCKANTVEDTKGPIGILETYINQDSMEIVRPAILLTLWYITGEKKYANEIKADYPDSIEMSVVKGDVRLLPTPFWFFLPKNSDIDFTSADMEIDDIKTVKEKVSESNNKWQLGFFRTESNASSLCKEVKSKGFDAYIKTEVRPSGTTYYSVIVDEDESGNVSEKLRNAGYDCCLLE